MKKKSFVWGTLILAASSIIAKFLGFFFRIPLIYLIGEEGIGLYQITYPLYTFLLSFAFGVPTAISKMISERLAVNKKTEACKIFRVALIVMLILGGVSSGFIILFSKNIIHTFNWSVDVYYSLLGISLAPFFTCLLSAYRGYFQGFQYMTPSAASQIIEQLVRVFIGVGLAYFLLPKGLDAAAGGASFGATAGAFIGLLFLIYVYRKNMVVYNIKDECKSGVSLFSEILKISIPVSIAHAIGSIMALIDSMIVPGLLRDSGYSYQIATILYGQLTGKAFVLVNVPLTLSAALAQGVVPAVSEQKAFKNRAGLSSNIKAAYKLALVLALPCCAGLYILAEPILGFIFQGKTGGWELLQILSIAAVFIIVAQTSTGILNGVGKTIIPIIAMATGCVVKLITSFILVQKPELNIKGAAYSTLISYITIAIIDIIMVIKYTKVRINLYQVLVLPLLCTAVMTFTVVFIFTNMYNLTGKTGAGVITSVFSGIALYITMLLITGTMRFNDIKKFIKNR